MSPLFRINPPGSSKASGAESLGAKAASVQPAENVRLLKAKDWAIYCQAASLLENAQAEAERIKLQAKEAFEQEKKLGYAQGLEDGRLELSEQMMDTVTKALDYLESLEGDMVNLVKEAIKKILGSLPDQEIITGVVRKALSLAQSQRRVILRVSNQDKPVVQEKLAGLMRDYASIEFVDVVGDSRLNPGDCMLESELGVIDTGLSTQIKAISNTLDKRQKG